MPFGQSLENILTTAISAAPQIIQAVRPQVAQPIPVSYPTQFPGFETAAIAPAITQLLPQIGRAIPPIVGGMGLGELLEQLSVPGFAGAPGCPTLFRQTEARMRPVPEVSLVGPDGKTHTWLHARPIKWRINRVGIVGRRSRRNPR